MNLQLAIQGASQGLENWAGLQARREAAEIEFLRRENLTLLQQRQQFINRAALQDREQHAIAVREGQRDARTHGYRDEEIDRQEGAVAQRQTQAQSRDFAERERLQGNQQTFEGEYRTRAGMAQQRRQLMLERNAAAQQMTTLRSQLMQRAHQLFGSSSSSNNQAFAQALAAAADDPKALDQLMKDPNAGTRVGTGTLRQLLSDPIGSAIAKQYRDARGRYDAANTQLSSDQPGNFATDMAGMSDSSGQQPTYSTDTEGDDDPDVQSYPAPAAGRAEMPPDYDPTDDEPAVDPATPPIAASPSPLIPGVSLGLAPLSRSLGPSPVIPTRRNPRVGTGGLRAPELG